MKCDGGETETERCKNDAIYEITEDNCGCGLTWTYLCYTHAKQIDTSVLADPLFRTKGNRDWEYISQETWDRRMRGDDF